MITGVLAPDSGRIRFAGRDITGMAPHRIARLGLSRTLQHLNLSPNLSLLENVALGVSLGEGTGGLALLVAIFVSNFPESLVGSASMRAQGRSRRYIVGMWVACAALLTVAVVVGAGPLAVTPPETISLPLAFAAGAVLASLADTLMPEAYEKGGPTVALSTAAGFVLSFYLATL